jgi:hypothetical protein
LTPESPGESFAPNPRPTGGIVARHASESYHVLGEGLLTVSAGGRDSAGAAETAPFRFSRMGPKGRRLDEKTTRRLGEAMTAAGGESKPSRIPAGFTYLGQFVAHDLTFDRTRGVMLGANVSPAELLQGRSPSLDLDSLYGAGPHDPGSALFYERDGIHLRTGDTVADQDIPEQQGFDLPRAADGRQALIPDERNDDNLAVAQTHLAFIRFHNRVVDALPASVPPALRFAQARELVTKHYQWLVWNDYLPRICDRTVLDDVRDHGRRAFEPAAEATAVPTMPIEFSIGTFRLGHSMVRRSYNWNRHRDDVTLALLFRYAGKGGDLGGNDRLPSTMIADFRRLYDFSEAGRPDLGVDESEFNRAMPINTSLVSPLEKLPPGIFGGTEAPVADPDEANLAFRNLTRARMVELATGQDMAGLLRRRGVTLTPLTASEILAREGGARLAGFTDERARELAADTPLWFYVLREAERNDGKLGGVGARIVAETFHRAIEGSRTSIVRETAWRPSLGPGETTFRMADLLLFACDGKLACLAPLEG